MKISSCGTIFTLQNKKFFVRCFPQRQKIIQSTINKSYYNSEEMMTQTDLHTMTDDEFWGYYGYSKQQYMGWVDER